MAAIRVVRKITYEVDEKDLDQLVIQMAMSMPTETKMNRGRVSIYVEHLSGAQWHTDGKAYGDGSTARLKELGLL